MQEIDNRHLRLRACISAEREEPRRELLKSCFESTIGYREPRAAGLSQSHMAHASWRNVSGAVVLTATVCLPTYA